MSEDKRMGPTQKLMVIIGSLLTTVGIGGMGSCTAGDYLDQQYKLALMKQGATIMEITCADLTDEDNNQANLCEAYLKEE